MPHLPRTLLRLAGAAGAAVLLAACSSGGGSSTSDAPYSAPEPNLSAHLTYAVWDQTQVKAIDANLAEFAKKYPNIKVDVDVTPYNNYFTKLQTEASSDSLPDVFWMNGPNFQLYASNGKIEPITGEVKAGAVDPANYPDSLDKLYTVDGVQYGVPKDFDTIGIWVNKALFAKAGIPVPDPSWTWADFQNTAKQLSQKLGGEGIYGVSAGIDSGQTTYYNTIFQSGGSVISPDGKTSGYDSPATAKGIQFWTDLISSKAMPNIKQLTDTTGDQWFVSGKSAMFQGGSWNRSEIADSPIAKDVTVLPLPKGDQQATVIHGVSNVVAASSQNKQAAQALQVFLASKEAQQQQGDLGAVIPAYTGTQTAFAQSMPGVNLQVFLDELPYAKALPVSKNTAAWNNSELSLLPDAFDGTKPVDAVLKELAGQMNQALSQE
ncbi:multiple sugar transport system substrate-binding protein [Amycolatopsis bartoniae]|uniref:Sugar ABC transporter substrate-binding protein n=1 Tax=Amycolatopsis bartoniae TaxID=941986 RepID=A0A8H9IRB1_9PSEU|nr:sugar ABC transporter substrate-binding protein [Amycolatopsis bartoniae]MBB2937739.1 multiple sugar transport system substrate-binding protein [Amycolatopsis bartoniae]TVT08179.1 sugar ABC transporter substrate-binding protein [Amycolatopsis bartoniae]GHF40356.1 sugar ABC transporter substrate-binding protein [Amycolatopsis bartoniae]